MVSGHYRHLNKNLLQKKALIKFFGLFFFNPQQSMQINTLSKFFSSSRSLRRMTATIIDGKAIAQ